MSRRIACLLGTIVVLIVALSAGIAPPVAGTARPSSAPTFAQDESPVAAPAATPAAGAALATYVSPFFGYTYRYDDTAWMTASSSSQFTLNGDLYLGDIMALTARSAPDTLWLEGGTGTWAARKDLPECVRKAATRRLRDAEGQIANEPVMGRSGEWAQVELEYTVAGDDGVNMLYVACRWLDGVTLTVYHTAPAASYPESVLAREEVLATLDVSGVPAALAILAATPIATSAPDQ